ncbi:MAG: hypothetical protein IJI73_08475 [Kiritimatiellae bacterium]|nr:hypothetical protein [Kiritimatiellia bacterium]
MGSLSFRFGTALCATVLIAASAFGEVLVYEGFSSGYATGNINGKKPNAASIGLNTSTGWNSGTGVFTIRESSLSVPNAWTASGTVRGTQARSVAESNTAAANSGWTARRAQYCAITSTWPTSGSLYFRFLMRIPAALVQTSCLGKGNYWMAGLGTENPSNPTGDNAAPASGVYFGMRNDNGALKLSAYVLKGGETTATWYDFATLTPSTQLDCVCVAKIDIGTGGADTLSLYAVPTANWRDDFAWTHTVENANLVSSSTKLSKLVVIGQYPTGGNDVVFDEFLVSTVESEAYTHVAPGAPMIGDVALSRTGVATYSISATVGVNAADVFWVADDGANVATNDLQAGVAVGGTATGTISGLAADKTYRISALAKNDNGSYLKEAGVIYTGELTLGAKVDASEAKLTAGSVAVSRAGNDPFPLSLNYTITGTTGTQGVTWEAPAEVVIPEGSDTGSLIVQPLVDFGVDEDITVKVTLASGNYEVKDSPDDSKDLQILNSDTPQGYEFVTITNAFENPAGGYFWSDYKTQCFTNTSNRAINFAQLGDGESGLREFVTEYGSDIYAVYVSRDWLLYAACASNKKSASTQTSVRVAETEATEGVKTKRTVYTYAGSWRIPTDGVYSFRMNMFNAGVFSLDGRLVLKQSTGGTAVTTNGVALSAGWHNFCVSFLAHASQNKIGPASGETLGFSFSAGNAQLTKAEPGSAFNSDNCEFNTAFNAVLLPCLCAKGGDLVVNCANVVGNFRVANTLASRGGNFKIVNLPADGTLEFGRPVAISTHGYYGYQSLETFAFVDWSKTAIPFGASVRFEGSIAVNSTWTSSGHSAYALGNHVVLATDVANFFGVLDQEFRYPDGLAFLHVGTPQVLGQTAKVYVPANGGFGACGNAIMLHSSMNYPAMNNTAAYTFENDIELGDAAAVNGSLIWNGADNNGNVNILSGNITGNGGVKTTGYSHRLTMKGQVNVASGVGGQRACRLNFCPKAGSGPSSISGTVELSGEKDVNYAGASIFYCPETPGEHPFSIGTLSGIDADWVEGRTFTGRRGVTISTCSNNTYNIGSLIGAGIHLRAVVPTSGGVWNVTNDKEDVGPANFVFGQINGSAGMNIYVSSNVSVTVTNIVKAAAFHYEVMSNGVNAAVLDIEGTVADGTTITATDVAMLPARIKGFVGDITLTDTTPGRTYDVVYDFDRGVAIGGCDGSGNLVAAPASGTINLSFTGSPR